MGLLAGLAEGLLEMAYPTRCAGCDLPGSVLCDRCRGALPFIDRATACPRCGAPFGRLVCTECWNHDFEFSAGVSVGSLEHPLSRLVTLYKDAGERRLAHELAGLLVAAVEPWRGWADVVTHVPATPRAQRRRGFDHAAEVTAEVADALGVPHVTALSRRLASDQRALGRVQRFTNACGTFEAISRVRGRVLLVDDVLTTGATVDDAARSLIRAGATDVRVATIARAW